MAGAGAGGRGAARRSGCTRTGRARRTRARPGAIRPRGCGRRRRGCGSAGLDPLFFCGGGWYTDAAVREAVTELGLVDCTPRGGVPVAGRPADDAFARAARARRARPATAVRARVLPRLRPARSEAPDRARRVARRARPPPSAGRCRRALALTADAADDLHDRGCREQRDQEVPRHAVARLADEQHRDDRLVAEQQQRRARRRTAARRTARRSRGCRAGSCTPAPRSSASCRATCPRRGGRSRRRPTAARATSRRGHELRLVAGVVDPERDHLALERRRLRALVVRQHDAGLHPVVVHVLRATAETTPAAERGRSTARSRASRTC